MATEHEPVPQGPRPVVANPQPGRPEEFLKGHPPRTPEPRSGGGGVGTVLTSAVIALVAGGAGAWGYLNYLHPALGRQQPQAEKSAAAAPGPDDAARRLEDMSHRLEELQSRVDKLPKQSGLPDLEPINQKLSAVDDLSRKVEAERTRIGALPEKIDQNARKITAMMADLDGFKNQLTTLRTDIQSAKTAST